ncbi:MAG TPA: LysR substrate-binding domain-containing protein [Acidimicrobiales bacterium]|nr:LysR substrate-binding domain-containing protein [Acidimicrobiales bacterium]
MQLHQLRYVVSVADERSFTKAAAGLLVAQPSVSAAVRALERELGVELFHRSGGHVILSPAGEAFLPWARQVLADCDAGVAAVGDLLGLQRGRLSLGATPSITTDLLPPVLADFHRRYPKVDVSLREGGSRRLVDSLERGDLELAVVILPVEKAWVRAEPLVNEQLVLALPPGHPLTGRDRASVHDLAELPLVMFRDGYDLRETTLAMCRRAGFQPPFAVEGLEMDGVLACCAAGVGAAVVPASVGSQGGRLQTVPFVESDFRRTIGLASRADRARSQAAKAFVDILGPTLAGPVTLTGPMTLAGPAPPR